MTRHLPALDGLRGVAVAMVVASHAFPMLPELPWAVKRFSNLGFLGVQLFFVVSGVTLAHSWRRGEASGTAGLGGFALRRVFRIAPGYFLAAVLYAWLLPSGPVDAVRLATFATFTNGWTPAQMPTVAGAWAGVPGGWSVEAEFAFYALFPLLMAALPGLPRTFAALVVSMPCAWLANLAGQAVFEPAHGWVATDQFLYYWLPNQLPVFLCGLVAYEAAMACAAEGRLARRVAAAAPVLLAVSVLAVLSLALLPWPRRPQADHAFLSTTVIAGASFGAATVALTVRPVAAMVQPWLVGLGQASFSAYLLHFAVIAGLERWLPPRVFAQTGMAAVATSGALFLLVLATTGLLAQATHRLVERPGMRCGGILARRAGRHGVRAMRHRDVSRESQRDLG